MKRSSLRLSPLLASGVLGLLGCGSTVIDGDESGGGGSTVVPPIGGAGLGNQGGSGEGGFIGPNGGFSSVGGAGGSIDPTGGAGGEDPGVFDCATAPTTAQSTQMLPGVRGYHGLAIDELGLMYGIDQNSNLIRSTYDGAWTPFLNNVQADQMEFAPDGDLHLASYNAILTATPSAQLLTLNASQDYTYGLRMGPDGKVWIADSVSIRRIDPNTGIAETVTSISSSDSAHSFDFNRSFDRLYIGTIGSESHIRKVDLDVNYNAIGAPQPFVQLPTDSVWLDGIATDVCGNLYVVNYTTSDMFRVTPEGAVTLFVDWSSSQYGHGAIFGNGKFGFREDAIYVPQPYNGNTVMEVVVGIPGREWDGTVLNGPTP